jgi:hypothetical protein
VTCEIAGHAERMDMHSIATSSAMRSIHGFTAATSTFGSGVSIGPGAPLWSDEVEVVELTMVIERASPAATLTTMRSAVPRRSGRSSGGGGGGCAQPSGASG